MPAPATSRKSGSTILLVDDDPAVREGLRRVLTGEGLEVITASGGAEALRSIEEYEPCLMITDLGLAPNDGRNYLVREKRLRPKLPIVVVTSLPARECRGADRMADAFFQKPIDLDALLAAIRLHLPASPSIEPAALSPNLP